MLKHPTLPDNSLIEQYRSTGDINYLGELYARYMHLVYGVGLKYLGNREEAKDAVMQIFEKLVSEVGRYEVRQFKSWLYVLTKNYCLMQLRSGMSRLKREKIWVEEQEIIVESQIYLHPIDREEAFKDLALKDCVEKLKENQRKCIENFYFENKCYSEIAILMETDEKRVKSFLQNGKRNLKICLEGKNVRQ